MSCTEVMVVDDDEDGRECLHEMLLSLGHKAVSYADGDSALRAIARGYSPPIAILDVMMPGTDGLEVLRRLKAMSPATSVIMLSGVSLTETIAQAGRLGAVRYLQKPTLPQDLDRVVQQAAEAHRLATDVQTIEDRLGQVQAVSEIITADEAMVRIQEVARRVADTDVSVLLMGESGVGKEVVARFTHDHSSRKSKPFIKVNCAALPHELLESELFGHQKGSFTGAIADKAGKFEQAHGGTIFLDEIGEMSPLLQAKLLHVLQDGEFSRVGGKAMKVDARVIAATNKRLEESIRKKEFREDLYYRLNVVRITIPPLRERPADVPLLLQYFLKKYAQKYQRPCRALPPELLAAFGAYHWPGNVRELENAIKRYVVLQDVDTSLQEMERRPRVETVEIPEAPAVAAAAEIAIAPAPLASGDLRSLKKVGSLAAQTAEKELVFRTLQACGWNRKQAARELGVCYKALLNKLKRWNAGEGAMLAPPPMRHPASAGQSIGER
jgi:two-component system, NtrC family, response regulator AtoC